MAQMLAALASVVALAASDQSCKLARAFAAEQVMFQGMGEVRKSPDSPTTTAILDEETAVLLAPSLDSRASGIALFEMNGNYSLGSGEALDMEAAKDVPFWKAAIVSLIPAGIAVYTYLINLNLTSQLLICGVRGAAQLSILGYMLTPIMFGGTASIVLAYIFFFMTTVAAYEACAQPKMTYNHIFRNCFITISASCLVGGVVLYLIILPTPWWDPVYAIPLTGMVISNCLTGIAPGLNMLLDLFDTRRDDVELALAFGAGPYEASWPAVRQSIHQALIPAINGMNVLGLVSIPGLMTGQVLGGSSPITASRYQLVISFLNLGTTLLSVLMIAGLTARSVFDGRMRQSLTALAPSTMLGINQVLTSECCRRQAPSGEPKGELPGAPDSASTPPLPISVLVEREAAGHGAMLVMQVDVQGQVAGRRPLRLKFDLFERQVVCIVGPSGIGKSTALKMLCDLWEVAAGSVRTLHTAKKGPVRCEVTDPRFWRRQVLYLPQLAGSLPGNPRDLMTLIGGLHVNKNATLLPAPKLLQALGLSEEILGSAWTSISAGEKQRIMLALAFSMQPAVLLLDEPTSNLDHDSVLAFEELLRAQDCAVVMVSHDQDQVRRLADVVLRFEK